VLRHHLFWLFLLLPAARTAAQSPSGLAASALADTGLQWLHRELPGIRIHTLADSYPALHQDSLAQRIPSALAHAQQILGVGPLDGPLDVFFVESRDQMLRLTGARATGLAQPSSRTVVLVTNPEWRAFDRHEVMHVVVARAWGAPATGNDWLVEGLAQAADGRCGDWSNGEVLRGLAWRSGWIPLSDVLERFRQQPDLRAYLQAAAFTQFLIDEHGVAAVRRLWSERSRPDSSVGGETLAAAEARWKQRIGRLSPPPLLALQQIAELGCG
jgi:hypothetical protein